MNRMIRSPIHYHLSLTAREYSCPTREIEHRSLDKWEINRITLGRLTLSNAIDLRQSPYQDPERDIATSWEAGWTEAQQQRKAFESKAAHCSGMGKALLWAFYILIIGTVSYGLYWILKACVGFINYYSKFV
jgi:hypothetical protein